MAYSCSSLHLKILAMWKYLLWIFMAHPTLAHRDMKSVSQCYSENGFSFISLYCGNDHVIQIHRAIHGSHPNPRIHHCGRIHGDCISDVTRYYDWDKCEGQAACVQDIKYMNMEKCHMKKHYELVNDTEKFKRHAIQNEATQQQLQYLEVDYYCIHVESREYAQKQQRNKARKKSNKVEIERDICTNYTEKASSILLQNPGYPHHYQANVDCRCLVQAPDNTKISVTFRDLLLVMQEEFCVDWLLLKSPGHKDSTVVACGSLDGETRTVESKSNWLLMHFHTSRSTSSEDTKHTKRLSGFQIEIQSEPSEKFNMKCYTVDPTFIDNLSKNEDDGLSNLVLPASDWDEVSRPGALQSSSPPNTRTHVFTLLNIVFVIFVRCIL